MERCHGLKRGRISPDAQQPTLMATAIQIFSLPKEKPQRRLRDRMEFAPCLREGGQCAYDSESRATMKLCGARNLTRTHHDLSKTLNGIFLLSQCQLRKNRQAQHFRCGLFGYRQAALAVAQVFKARLLVQRDWIIDLRSNVLFCQLITYGVTLPAGDANRELVPDVVVAFGRRRLIPFR